MDDRPESVEESNEHTPHITGSRGRRAVWRLAALGGTLAIALAALVVVAKPDQAAARVRLQVSAHPHPEELNYVIGSLPDGFAPSGVRGADSPVAQYVELDGSGQLPLQQYELFGSAADPSKPTLWIIPDNRWEDYTWWDIYKDVTKFSFMGRSGICARYDGAYDRNLGPRRVMCWLDRTADSVMVQGTGVDIDVVKTAVEHVVSVNGTPHLPTSAVPAGMTLVEKGTRTSVPQYPVATAWYPGPSGSSLQLTVGWADEVDLPGVRQVSREWTTAQVGTSTAFVSQDSVNGRGVIVWIADGKAFTLTVNGVVDLAKIARSVRPASTAEWTGLHP
jgi:hypothetical protein